MTTHVNTMDAAVLHAAGDLRLERVAVPSPEDDGVLIRITCNGICGSDIHFFEEGRLGPFTVTKPYIPGHEACGVVEEAPADVPIRRGMRVAVEPGIPCRRCRHCKTGRYNLCPNVVFLSAPPVDGTFADYVTVPWDFAHPLPEELDDEAGAFVEPVSVAVQACNRGGLQPGATVIITGGGPIGLVTLLVALAYGAGKVIVADLLEHRLRLAESLGAHATINAGTSDLLRAALDVTEGDGADLVIDTSGSSAACARTPELSRRGGVVVLVGWPELPSFDYPVEQIIERELDVRGVNRYCNTYPQAISLMEARALDIKSLISHRFDFADVVEAFTFAAHNRSETVKVMVASST